ncbi:hypothetical protein E2C01_003251 [Portunus trituberculatus]|uniref:Uncharacterized protein n=1 Tax=Portunus trituberculatus TaxID=210409 RepID=A0A5B7CPQ9_PORTR|nr:hypothetical protein [Portunus trituberculatus]
MLLARAEVLPTGQGCQAHSAAQEIKNSCNPLPPPPFLPHLAQTSCPAHSASQAMYMSAAAGNYTGTLKSEGGKRKHLNTSDRGEEGR